MEQNKMGLGVVLVACLAALFQISSAATHTVGGSSGWIIPSSSSPYSSWAAKQTFKVGDVLVFNFQTGQHTVAEVSKSDYDGCTSSNAISTASNGPANMTIKTAGAHYYICTIPGHCSAGQKLAVTTAGGGSASPSASPTSPAAPSPSGATSPESSTTPSAQSPAGGSSGTTAPSPSSATVAGAGMVLPFLFVGAALLF